LNCEYIHDGDAPPEICPVCGAPAERFEPFEEAQSLGIGQNGKQRIVVVGAGIAGVSAAESIRKMSPEADITLYSKEKELPYYRLNLTRYLAGEVDGKDLPLHPETWYSTNNIQLIGDSECCGIDPEKKRVQIRGKKDSEFDKLVLSIGSHPFVPPFTGVQKENVTVLRTKTDADFILQESSKVDHIAVIGGGLLGLETAGALARRGYDVTLLEGHGWLLPRQLNKTAGIHLESHIKESGIRIRKKAITKEIVGDERVRGIHLEDGETIPAELIIITTGVRSNSYIARLANLDVHRGIVVNNRLQTSHPDIFAAGDVSEHLGVIYGTWGPSQFQGTFAGMNAVGSVAEFAGIPRSNMLKVLGYDLFSIGEIHPEDASYRVVESASNGEYFFFMFRDSQMVGAILLGDTRLSAQTKKIVEKNEDCAEILSGSLDHEAVLEFLESK
jgi:nitrite reductase (NADH) large subunit